MKRNIKKVLVTSVCIVSVGLLAGCNSKSDKLMDYVDKGKYEDAFDYFEDKIVGSMSEEKICDELEKTITKKYDDIVEKYGNGKVNADELEKLYDLLDEIDVSDEDIQKLKNKITLIDNSKEAFENGVQYFENKSYESAQNYFKEVDKLDSNYKKAQDYLVQIGEKIVEQANEKIDSYFNDGAFYNARNYIDNLKSLYPDVEELGKLSDNLEQSYKKYMMEKAAELAKNNKYQEAMDKINNVLIQTSLSDDAELIKLKAEYESYIPVSLVKLEYSSIEGTRNNSSSYRKCIDGKTYNSSYFINIVGVKEAFCEYNIDGKYNTFTGKAGVSDRNSSTSDSKYFEIYGDGKLLYTSPVLTKDSKTEDFQIDVTDVKVLRIVYPASQGNNSIAMIYDGTLQKR